MVGDPTVKKRGHSQRPLDPCCPGCGSRLRRHDARKGPRWQCENPNCMVMWVKFVNLRGQRDLEHPEILEIMRAVSL